MAGSTVFATKTVRKVGGFLLQGHHGHRLLQNDTKSHLLPRVSGQDRKLSGNRYFHIEPRGPKTVPKSFLSCGMPLQHPRDQAKQGIIWGFSPKFQTRVVLSHCRWDQKMSEQFAFAFPPRGSYQSHTRKGRPIQSPQAIDKSQRERGMAPTNSSKDGLDGRLKPAATWVSPAALGLPLPTGWGKRGREAGQPLGLNPGP